MTQPDTRQATRDTDALFRDGTINASDAVARGSQDPTAKTMSGTTVADGSGWDKDQSKMQGAGPVGPGPAPIRIGDAEHTQDQSHDGPELA